MSETCIILHNMLVRMNQEGVPQEDVHEEVSMFGVVGELYEEERTRYESRTAEKETQGQLLDGLIDADGNSDFEAMRIRESSMTLSTGFYALRQDLVNMVHRRGRRQGL